MENINAKDSNTSSTTGNSVLCRIPLDALKLASPELDEIVGGANAIFKVNSSSNVEGVIGIGGAGCSKVGVNSEVFFKNHTVKSIQN